MGRKRKIAGGILAVVGFMLSPLSWWNDAFVNLPLALCFAWVISLFYKPAFEVSLIAGYWLTNVIGFVLMHKGARQMLQRGEPGQAAPAYTRRELVKDVAISLFYTGLILVLLKVGLLKPIAAYFPRAEIQLP